MSSPRSPLSSSSSAVSFVNVPGDHTTPGPSTSSPTVFTITGDGQSGQEKTVKMREHQINTTVLSKVFSFLPDSIYLVSDEGDVSTSDDNGKFTMIVSDARSVTTWTCCGDKLDSPHSAMISGVLPSNEMKYLYQFQGSRNQTRNISFHSSGKGKARQHHNFFPKKRPPGVDKQEYGFLAEWIKNIEIFKWNGDDKSWEKLCILPVNLTEETANPHSISEMVSRDSFEGKDIVLMDIEYYRILDVASTKGATYWKTAKKIRAALKTDFEAYEQHRTRLKRASLMEPGPSGLNKKRKTNAAGDLEFRLLKVEETLRLHDKEGELLLAKAEIESLKLKVSDLQQTLDTVAQSFSCVICMKILSFPMYMSPCCGIILGCHTCLIEWLADNSTCPHCRATIETDDLIDFPKVRALCNALSSYNT